MLADPVRDLACRQDALVTAQQALACGLSREDIRRLIRRNEWLAVTRGVYLVDADLYVDGLTSRMWRRAALLAHGPTSCLVGATALRVLGVAGLPGDESVIEIAVPDGASVRHRATSRGAAQRETSGPRFFARQLVVPPDQLVCIDGMTVRAIVPSLADVGLLVTRPTALALLDSALH